MTTPTLDHLPAAGHAAGAGRTAVSTPEARGVARDGVRLLVAESDAITHTRFTHLTNHVNPGDLIVVNSSATVAAQVDATTADGAPLVVHLALRLDNGQRVVELRTAPEAERPILDANSGDVIQVGPDVTLTLVSPYPDTSSSPTGAGNRLWRSTVDGDLDGHVQRAGRPIAYGYLDRRYPLADYQSVFGAHPGSAEMPSAGRPFTSDLIARLLGSGVGLATITLHTGVSSQEVGEGPQAEWFDVPSTTARLVNATIAEGHRVIAVGTTVTRALESVVTPGGRVEAGTGWTDRIISEAEPARIVTGLITGWHDPEASHLALVESVAGKEITRQAYAAALTEGYLWHEFGDSALLLPPPAPPPLMRA